MNDYLGDLGLILLLLVLTIVIIPILCGIGIGFLFGVTGLLFYGVVIIVSVIIWSCLYVLWWL